MLKCPFCNFQNEDGALFCEQCKSDLGAVASTPADAAGVLPEPVPMAAVIEELIPMASVEAALASAPVAVADVAAPPSPVAVATAAAPPGPPVAVVTAASPPAPVAAAPEPAVVAASTGPTPVAPPPAAAAPSAAEGAKLPADAKPKLVVLRGQKINAEFPIYEGLNFIGRADEKPVDIDLEDQEPPDRIWCSRQHALINLEGGIVTIEDLNSANGTYVNRGRIYPGQKRSLNVGDVIQIGTVQMKVKI
jgi:FHA domain